MVSHQSERKEIIKACLYLNKTGLNQGTSGNISIRVSQNEFLVTPSGIPFENLTLDKIVPVKISPAQYIGDYRPTSEWRMHRSVYRKFPLKEAGSVVHTHSHFSTTISCMRRSIPAFHYMVMVAGGSKIPCAEYATVGSTQLSDNIISVLKDGCRACLLANHGLLVYARTLRKALYIATEVENLARQYFHLLSSGQNFTILNDREMARVFEVTKGCCSEGDYLEKSKYRIAFPPRVEEDRLRRTSRAEQVESKHSITIEVPPDWKEEENMKNKIVECNSNMKTPCCKAHLQNDDSTATAVGEARDAIFPLAENFVKTGSMLQLEDQNADEHYDEHSGVIDVLTRRFQV